MQSFLRAIPGLAVALFLSANPAHAAYLVDTGDGGTGYNGTSLDHTQWISGQFSLSSNYTLSSVEGWFGLTSVGTATATIYQDGITGLPDTPLFSTQFLLDSPVAGNAWDGAYNLGWSLSPGTYWLSFEVRTSDTGSGYMPDNFLSPNGSANPMAGYAVYHNDTSGSGWVSQSSSLGYGMRVASVVPVPAAAWLFSSGLLGLAGIARRGQLRNKG